MVAYTGIQGQNILIVDTDPANPTEGQIWYNSTSNLLKGYANVVVNAWASGGNMNTGRESLGGTGTQTAALAFAGGTVPTYSTATESYNGSSWTSLNPVNTGRGVFGSAGTQGASFMFGGQLPSTNQSQATENWNGTSWSNGNNYPVFGYHRATGTQTAAITIIGQTSPDGNPGSPQVFPAGANTYNGTSYTSSASYNTGRRFGGMAGIQTAALLFGGQAPGSSPDISAATESWNGTSWTTLSNLNQNRTGLAGAGLQTAALAFGGNNDGPTQYSNTELWNGTSWTANPTGLATARSFLAGAGTQTAGIAFGGNVSPKAQTEEWTGQAIQVRTITTS